MVHVWSDRLAEAAVALDRVRERQADRINRSFPMLGEELLGAPCRLEYRKGWSDASDLLDIWNAHLDNDRMGGFTRIGPHTANVVITVGGNSAREGFSRGQEKLITFALMSSQVGALVSEGSLPALLIDDLGAELDRDNQRRVMQQVGKLECQVIVTAVGGDDGVLPECYQPGDRVFHVKQGDVTITQPSDP